MIGDQHTCAWCGVRGAGLRWRMSRRLTEDGTLCSICAEARRAAIEVARKRREADADGPPHSTRWTGDAVCRRRGCDRLPVAETDRCDRHSEAGR